MAGNLVQTIMADRMLQDFEGDRSYQGELALLRRQENCIRQYGKEATEIPKQQWMAIFHGSES